MIPLTGYFVPVRVGTRALSRRQSCWDAVVVAVSAWVKSVRHACIVCSVFSQCYGAILHLFLTFSVQNMLCTYFCAYFCTYCVFCMYYVAIMGL